MDRAVRTALRQRFPTAYEIVYANYNFFVIGYSATERPSEEILSIAAAGYSIYAAAQTYQGRDYRYPYVGARLARQMAKP